MECNTRFYKNRVELKFLAISTRKIPLVEREIGSSWEGKIGSGEKVPYSSLSPLVMRRLRFD